MLFADAVASELPSAGSAISWGAAVVTSLFAYLASRDRLKFDAERQKMQADIKILTAQVQGLSTEITECHEERSHQAGKIEAQDGEIKALWAKLAEQAAPESSESSS